MSLRYDVKLKMLIAHVLALISYEKNSGILPTLTVASKFARFESS